MAKYNRRYKDSVFVDLFGEDKNAKEKFLSLYNALHGTTFDAATKLEPLRLELVVSVININYNKSSKLLSACKPLKEYTLFVAAVRKHTKLDSENGFKNAITECIQNDILCEYLQRKSKEVINMLSAEYDYDVDIAVQREEASHQKALQDAKNLKRLGVSISIITESTGLTREEVETL